MKRNKYTILALLCWFVLPLSYGQQVEVTASLDTNRMLIGEQVALNLQVVKPKSVSVFFPVITDTVSKMVEVLKVADIDSVELQEDLVQLSRSLTITAFDSGFHRIGPMPFIVKKANQQTDTLYTEPTYLDVYLVEVDTTEAIKPIKGPVGAPYTLRDVLPWLLGGVLLLAVLIGVYTYLKRRKKPEAVVVAKPVPKEPPHVIAFRDLDKLKEAKLWQEGKVKAYHSQLTEIIRTYIEHRFKIPALEQTSDEILSSFRNSGLDKEVPFESLQQMLVMADLVKFAKGTPLAKDNYRVLEEAYDFVKKTTNNNEE